MYTEEEKLEKVLELVEQIKEYFPEIDTAMIEEDGAYIVLASQEYLQDMAEAMGIGDEMGEELVSSYPKVTDKKKIQ